MFFIYCFFGLFSGYLAGFLGVGAGVFLMPFFLLLNVPYQIAVGASLMTVFFSSLTASVQNHLVGKLDWEAVVFVAIPAVIMSVLGNVFLIHMIPARVLMLVFSALLFLNVDILRYVNRRELINKGVVTVRPKKLYLFRYSFIGVIGGLSASLLGIGGGIFLVSLLMILTGHPIKDAVRLSIVVMIFTTGSSLVSELSQSSSLPYAIGAPSAIGAVIGSYFGVISIQYVSKESITRGNYIVSFVLAITMLVKVALY